MSITSFPRKIQFVQVLKNSVAFQRIKHDAAAKLGHAYIVSSRDDDTVTEFFTLVACLIFCEHHDACLDCAECRKILNNNNPDVIFLNEERKNIKVELVKDLTSRIPITTFSGRKLVFIERADLMNANSQNKLLKTLEEPPENVTIFLGVSNEAALFDTVRSRCRTVKIDTFSTKTVFEELFKSGYSKEQCDVAAACSEGMLGKALKIASDSRYSALYALALDVLKNLNKSPDIIRFDGRIAALKDSGELAEFTDILSVLVRDVMMLDVSPNLVNSTHIQNDLYAISATFSTEAAAKTISILNDTHAKLQLNVPVTSIVDDMLFSILEVKHKCPKS